MGRLFWKFFFFFSFAQITSIIAVSFIFWLNSPVPSAHNVAIEDSPPARMMVDAATETLRFGGESALKSLLTQWADEPRPQVYAVDATGKEILKRSVTPTVLHALGEIEDPRAVQNVKIDTGGEYTLFVPSRNARIAEMDSPPDAEATPPNPNGAEVRGEPPRPRHRIFPFLPMYVGLVASLIFAGLLAWYFSKPIKILRRAFEQAAGGNLKATVSTAMGARRDELADLGHGFDQMTAQLDTLILGQQRLLHYVSHELRSPLARLQVAIGLAKQTPEKQSPEHLESTLDRIELESMRMDTLLGEVLELSRLESGVMNLKKERVLLNDLLATVVDDARFEANAKQVDIAYIEDAHYELDAQPDLLYRAIENVVRNAIKYSPPNSRVVIETLANQQLNQLQLIISDQGIGIPETELADIFKPFYRASTSDASVTGHGMGLAISRHIIEMHGGAILLSNRATGGLRANISLGYVARHALS